MTAFAPLSRQAFNQGRALFAAALLAGACAGLLIGSSAAEAGSFAKLAPAAALPAADLQLVQSADERQARQLRREWDRQEERRRDEWRRDQREADAYRARQEREYRSYLRNSDSYGTRSFGVGTYGSSSSVLGSDSGVLGSPTGKRRY